MWRAAWPKRGRGRSWPPGSKPADASKFMVGPSAARAGPSAALPSRPPSWPPGPDPAAGFYHGRTGKWGIPRIASSRDRRSCAKRAKDFPGQVNQTAREANLLGAGPQSAVQAAHVPLARPALLTSTGTPAGRARKDNPMSLFRPRKFSYRLPNGSYRTPDGRRVKKDTPGAVRVDLGRSEIWYGTYKAADGTRRKVPLCSSKEASKQLLAKLRVDAKLAEHGLGDAFE